MILAAIIFVVFGAMVRYPVRTSARPWRVTAILAGTAAAIFLVSFLMEIDGGPMSILTLCCAGGSALCGVALRWREKRKKEQAASAEEEFHA